MWLEAYRLGHTPQAWVDGLSAELLVLNAAVQRQGLKVHTLWPSTLDVTAWQGMALRQIQAE